MAVMIDSLDLSARPRLRSGAIMSATPRALALLLEIGVEELPSSFVDAAIEALSTIAAEELAKARLAHGRVEAMGTPRRLAVVVHNAATQQADLDEEVIGPPESVAFRDGVPTKAAEAFAQKLGLASGAAASLAIVERPAGPKQKAGRYVVGRRVERGRPALALLPEALAAICAAIPFRKSMRWGNLEAQFGRPVQWIVALLGSEVVPFQFAGVQSGRSSRGHRFIAHEPFDVATPEGYVEDLRARHVVVRRAERVALMVERLAHAAAAFDAGYDPEPALVDENASLVEEPHVVTGSFEPENLELPAAVIRAVARGHQKYFCVQRSEDELLPHYLAVVNTANRPDLVAIGMNRVMRARLSDARFFWGEDLKTPLVDRLGKLEGIVFHNRLGTVREKVGRIARLAHHIAGLLNLSAPEKGAIQHAVLLCKCDLVTLMVGEFPELQGSMGRAYAKLQGVTPAIAGAIRDHYKPVGAQDAVAPTDIAAVLALADRFDTLAGCFAVGLAPTGAADPFALRRACIAALRTILDREYGALSFAELIGVAYDGFEGKRLDLSRTETVAKLEEFATERLRGLLASATSNAVADAVLAGFGPAALAQLVAFQARARALHAVVEAREPWLDKARTVAKRLAGISREARPVLHPEFTFAGSAKADDRALQALVQGLDQATAKLSTEAAVRQALMSMERVALELDRIFLETLVNDPADPLTRPRLETLAHGALAMLRLADFSKLA